MPATRDLFSEPPPAWLIRAAFGMRRMLMHVADQVVPPEWVLMERSAGMGQTQLLGAVARRGVADLLSQGPRSAEEIAVATQTHPDITHRMMRALASTGVFRRTDDGRYENSRLSEAMRTERPAGIRTWLQYFSLRSNVHAWGDFEQTWVTGHDSFRRNFGKNVWEHFEENPAEGEVFAKTLREITTTHAPIVSSLYPFREVQRICDVGGGMGTLLSELLLRHPHLTGILIEPEKILSLARPFLEEKGVAERVECVEGDFFEAVPSGADAYLLKNILHDWDDEDCGRILRSCRKAMKQGQRLLILETLLEPETEEGPAVLSDLQMMVVCANGRERSEAEYRRLLQTHGFQWTRTFKHPVISVVEGVAESG